MKGLHSILLLVVLCGCVKAPNKNPSPPAAVVQLQTAWRDDLSKREEFKRNGDALTAQVFENERLVAVEIDGRIAADIIESVLTTQERHLILLGDLEDLRKHPQLTEVQNPGTIGSGFSAYLTPDGKVVFLWIIPEG